jgi:hypothetical protein
LQDYCARHVLVEWHESAHAVVAEVYCGLRVDGVQVGYSGTCGETNVLALDPAHHLLVFLAGRRGERHAPAWTPELAPVADDPDSPDGRGIAAALAALRVPATLRGRVLSEATAAVNAMLDASWRRLDRLAQALRDQRVLDRAEVATLLDE